MRVCKAAVRRLLTIVHRDKYTNYILYITNIYKRQKLVSISIGLCSHTHVFPMRSNVYQEASDG